MTKLKLIILLTKRTKLLAVLFFLNCLNCDFYEKDFGIKKKNFNFLFVLEVT